jgi:hypothetical protein
MRFWRVDPRYYLGVVVGSVATAISLGLIYDAWMR